MSDWPRAIPEIEEHLLGVADALAETLDPALIESLEARRVALRLELAEAERRLREGR